LNYRLRGNIHVMPPGGEASRRPVTFIDVAEMVAAAQS
jgi:hypothetical protein